MSVKTCRFHSLLLLHQRLQLAIHVSDLKERIRGAMMPRKLSKGVPHEPLPHCLLDESVNSLGQARVLQPSIAGWSCPFQGCLLCLRSLVFYPCPHHLFYRSRPEVSLKSCGPHEAGPSASFHAAAGSCVCRAATCESAHRP